MKNCLLLLPILSIFLFACQFEQGTPLEKIDQTLAKSKAPSIGYSNVQLFTIGKDNSVSDGKQLMKMSIDYNTHFDQMGIFLFLDDHVKKEKIFKELASFDLSKDINEDGFYLGKKVLSLSEKPVHRKADSMYYSIVSHGASPNDSYKTLAKFKLKKPNTNPSGIQHYKRNSISDGEMIHLYSVDLKSGNGTDRFGYQAELVLMGYDSKNKEDSLTEIEDKFYNVIVHNDDFLTIPKSLQSIGEQSKEQSDYIGYAFGEDGK